MTIALDGFEVLRRLGKHADVFAVVRADVDKQARALVVKCLKAQSIGFDAVREVYKVLGQEQFGLVLDGLKDAEVKTILTRLDKHHPELKGGTTAWRRKHLLELAKGSSDPSPSPTKPEKKAAAGKKSTAEGKKAKAEPARLQSDVMDRFRKGGKD
jgi:hypothetical protein